VTSVVAAVASCTGKIIKIIKNGLKVFKEEKFATNCYIVIVSYVRNRKVRICVEKRLYRKGT